MTAVTETDKRHLGLKYSASVMVRARELHAGGFGCTVIPRLLFGEFGVTPHHETILRWVRPEHQERRFVEVRTIRARQRAANVAGFGGKRQLSAEWKLARLREMRAAGVSMRSIGAVAGVWWGDALSESQVRTRLGADA